MFPKSDKRRLYQLITLYLKSDIDEATFTDEFYYAYDQELDLKTLEDVEREMFKKLSEVGGRFSEFKEDHDQFPGVYYTKEQLRSQVLETKRQLGSYFTELEKKGMLSSEKDV